jgi:hypothetical protein
MRTLVARTLRMMLTAAAAVLVILPASAQVGQKATRPAEPHLPPGPSILGSADLIATSAANATGSYLWIVGPAEHLVMLCEKKDTDNDFSCKSKRLP